MQPNNWLWRSLKRTPSGFIEHGRHYGAAFITITHLHPDKKQNIYDEVPERAGKPRLVLTEHRFARFLSILKLKPTE